jgi:hypothetical protein
LWNFCYIIRWVIWKEEKTEVQREESHCSFYLLSTSLLDRSSQRLIEKWLGRARQKRDKEIEKEESPCHLDRV